MGSGKDGRILKEDILNFLARQTGAILPPSPFQERQTPPPDAAAAAAASTELEPPPPPAGPRRVLADKDVTEPLKGQSASLAARRGGATPPAEHLFAWQASTRPWPRA